MIVISYCMRGRRSYPLKYPTLERAQRAVEILVTSKPLVDKLGRAVHPLTGSTVMMVSGATIRELCPGIEWPNKG